jgi:dTDP-4-amino-4,6-dideoxygalactose transaminase
MGSDPEFIPWVRPWVEVDQELLADLQNSLESGRLTNQGPFAERLEKEAARFLGAEDAVALSTGTAALHLALAALDLAGAEAVLSAFTYPATLNAVIHAGMRPVFCDIDPDTWTLCPRALERVVENHREAKVVIPVNVFGVPPDLEALVRQKIAVVVDDAHGFGSRRSAGPVTARAYSLHATKILPAAEGGLLTAADPGLLEKVRRLRNHGLAVDPLGSRPGYNEKMSELHAAVGLCSLRSFQDALARRKEYATRLRGFIRDRCGGAFTIQKIPAGVESNHQNLGVLCRAGAADCRRMLEARGVGSRRYFHPPLHRLRFMESPVKLPVTDRVSDAILCLPLHSRMDEETLARIERALLETSGSRPG